MERTKLNSKVIRSVGYDAATSTMEIEFPYGRIYEYFDISQGVFEWLLRSPSKSGFFDRMIRDKYDYAQIEAATQPSEDLETLLRRSLRE